MMFVLNWRNCPIVARCHILAGTLCEQHLQQRKFASVFFIVSLHTFCPCGAKKVYIITLVYSIVTSVIIYLLKDSLSFHFF